MTILLNSLPLSFIFAFQSRKEAPQGIWVSGPYLPTADMDLVIFTETSDHSELTRSAISLLLQLLLLVIGIATIAVPARTLYLGGRKGVEKICYLVSRRIFEIYLRMSKCILLSSIASFSFLIVLHYSSLVSLRPLRMGPLSLSRS